MNILQYNRTSFTENDSGQAEVPPGLLRLTSGQFSQDILHRFADTDFRYEAQLYLRGRDAAIVVREGALLAYIDGSKNMVELAQLLDGYDYLIQDAARTLRTAKSDTVVLTGIWHDVDHEVVPRFEAISSTSWLRMGRSKPNRIDLRYSIGMTRMKAASGSEYSGRRRRANSPNRCMAQRKWLFARTF